MLFSIVSIDQRKVSGPQDAVELIMENSHSFSLPRFSTNWTVHGEG